MTSARILLVEDNPVNQAVAVAMLEDLGHEIDAAYNGAEALEFMAGSEYELVFMDCGMPVMDGFAATVAIRQREAAVPHGGHVPVVAFTANLSAEDRQDCLRAGMDDCLSKPFTKEQLGQIVDKWTGGMQPHAPARNESPRREATDANLPTLDAGVLRALDALGGPGKGQRGPRLAATFVDSTQRICREISGAAQASDTAALSAAGHSLKSSSAQVGAFWLSRLAKELEVAARAGDLSMAGDVATQILAEFENVREALAAAEFGP
ncbi:MAG: response regulator [bacterium]|nr:response regulator [bacterium]MCP5069103.1 response regulator [bacterium]